MMNAASRENKPINNRTLPTSSIAPARPIRENIAKFAGGLAGKPKYFERPYCRNRSAAMMRRTLSMRGVQACRLTSFNICPLPLSGYAAWYLLTGISGNRRYDLRRSGQNHDLQQLGSRLPVFTPGDFTEVDHMHNVPPRTGRHLCGETVGSGSPEP